MEEERDKNRERQYFNRNQLIRHSFNAATVNKLS